VNNRQTKAVTLKQIYRELVSGLDGAEAEIEARIIIEHVLKINPAELIANPEMQLTRNQVQKILEVRDLRNKKRVPLAYILEEAPFMDLKLFVNRDVLIPRPETELLVERVLEEIKERKIHQPVILDLGTGSGCIAVALKRALPVATVYASDISTGALNVAAINARRYETEITFVLGDYLDPFINEAATQSLIATPIIKTPAPYFDVIVSNPPYVNAEDYEALAPELKHEPKHALVGFPYEQIRDQALGLRSSASLKGVAPAALLKPGGFMAFEFGQGQTGKMLEIFPDACTYKDYSNIDRILVK
jgi:release factor glutamine methyltransferase